MWGGWGENVYKLLRGIAFNTTKGQFGNSKTGFCVIGYEVRK
jgi:hypothetical protein